MAYRGKPSKSCEACRKTKTKCDKGRPSCGQCRRTGRTCPGYRDMNQLVFRNETGRVVEKAKTAYRKKQNELLPVAIESGAASPQTPRICLPLPPGLRDRALGIFYSQFGSGFEGCYDYMPVLCTRPSGPTSDSLYDMIECIGMAYMLGSPDYSSCHQTLQVRMYEKHSAVLRSVNGALRDWRMAVRDETLAAIILLSVFETVTGVALKSLISWTNHIQGAAALAKARGPAQFQTDVGRGIFAHLRDFIMLSALQRCQPIPQVIIDLARHPAAAQSPHEIVEQSLFSLVADLCSLRHDEATAHDSADVLLARGRAIDAALEAWIAALPPQYAYTTKFCIPGVDDADVLDGFYHIYASQEAAFVWNTSRCARIITAAVMARQAGPLGLAEADEVQALQTLLCADICASLPYHRRTGMTAAMGNLVVWPLYTVAITTNVTARMRLWVLEQIQSVAQRIAMRQGVVLADALKTRWEITSWVGGIGNTRDGEEGEQ